MNPQDPLAQLRDLHLPEPVGWWPPAPGWWLLAAVLLAAAIALALLLLHRRRQNAYRLEAQAELLQAWRDCREGGDGIAYALTLNELLRRTALAAYPRRRISGLTGTAWLEFLDATAPPREAGRFSNGPGQLLLSLPYGRAQAEQDLAPLHSLGMLWLTHHRPLPTGREAAARA